MLRGLYDLHIIGKIVHRDIKPDNILMNREGQIKLSDFGICRNINNTAAQCSTYIGTYHYMSPERIK